MAQLLWGLLAFVGAGFSTAGADESKLLVLSQARVLMPFAPDGHTWHSATLPHRWGKDLAGFDGQAQYRLEVDIDTPGQQPWCLLLPHVVMNAAFAVNSVPIGNNGGDMEPPLSRNWHRPLLGCFPATLLHPGSNTIELRVAAYANRFGQVSQLHLGTEAAVVPVYKRLMWAFQTIHAIGSALLVVLALVIGFLWWRRRNPAWFWFAVTSLCWAISGLNIVVESPPMPTRLWEWLMQSSIGLVPIFMTLFLHRLQNRTPVGRERLILGISLAFCLTLLLCPLNWFFTVTDLWHGFAILIVTYAVAQVGLHYWRTRSWEFLVILISMGVILLFGIHDMAMQVSPNPEKSVFLLNFSVPAFLLVISMLLVNQFVVAARTAETLNQTLEQRIEQAQREIERNYRQILALEQEKWATEERSRITRDLHDGLGGLTTHIVLLADLGQRNTNVEKSKEALAAIANMAREAVAEIRGVMHSLDRPDNDWATLAAEWRHWGQYLTAPHNLEWRFETQIDPTAAPTTTQENLNLFRLYREALTNVIKHAQAHRVAVSLQVTPQQVVLKVCDDGVGLPDKGPTNTGVPHSGRGLAGMHCRVGELGGTVRVEQGEVQGTQVVVTLPRGVKGGLGHPGEEASAL